MPKSTSDCCATGCKRLWPKVRLGDVCEINYGTRVRRKDSSGGEFPVYGGGGETFRWPTYNRENQCIVSRFAMSEECVRFVKGKFFLNDSGLSVATKDGALSQEFLDWCLYGRQPMIYAMGRGSAQRNLEIDKFEDIQLPLPPLAEQKKIVEKVEKALKRVDALKAQFERMEKSAADYFKAALAETFAAVKGEKVKLGDVCDIVCGKTPLRTVAKYWNVNEVPWFTIDDMRDQGRDIWTTRQGISKVAAEQMRIIPENTVLLCCTASVGACAIARIKLTTNQQFNALILKGEDICAEYLYYYCLCLKPLLLSLSGKTTIDFVSKTKVESITIPYLDLESQLDVVKALDAAKAKSERMVAAARRGIEICGKMRKAILAEAFQ